MLLISKHLDISEERVMQNCPEMATLPIGLDSPHIVQLVQCRGERNRKSN